MAAKSCEKGQKFIERFSQDTNSGKLEQEEIFKVEEIGKE